LRENQSAASRALIRFQEFELDEQAGELRRAGALVRIASKPFSMLCYLAAHSDRAVPKDELLERLWPNVSVSEAALSSALKDLRRALGDEASHPRVVKTVRGRGIRFVADIDRRQGDIAVPRPAKTPAPSTSTAPPPFVGRTRELRELVRCVEESARGRPSMVLIVGDAGAGKTRLLEELVRDPCCAEFALARGDCEGDTLVPYLPFAQALRQRLLAGELVGDQPSDGDATLRRLLYPGQAETGIAWRGKRSDGTRERADLFAAIWRLLERLARARPTLLVIEDLHQADVASLELLASLAVEVADARSAGGLPLLFVATTQPPRPGDRLDVTLRRLERQGGCTSIELAGFSTRATGQLLAVLGVASPAKSVSDAVRETTGGNPFFIGQLLREVGGPAALSTAVPADLHAATAHRLSRLSDECRRVLTVAAFIGDRFGLLALGAATRRSPADAAAMLMEAVGLGLVVSEHGSFRFEHSLVRDALRDATSEDRRAEVHLDLASVFEDLYSSAGGEHAIEIAQHLVLAGGRADPDRLALFARRAGDQAFAVCAWHEAAFFYDAALTTRARLSVAGRAGIHFRAGLAASHNGAPERALLHYQDAAEAFKAAGDELGFAWAFMYAVRARFTTSVIGSGTGDDMHELEALIARLGEGQPALHGLLLETLAAGAWASGDNERAEDFAEQALAVGSSIEDDVVCFHACMGLALARFSNLRLREAVASWLDADAHARRSRDPWLRALAGPRITLALQQLGRFDEARTRASEAEDLAHRAHNTAELSFALAQQGALELATGNFAAADERACAALAHTEVEVTHFAWGIPVACMVRACAAAERGRSNDAAAALSELVRRSQAFDEGRLIGAIVPAALRELVRAYRAAEEIDRDGFADLVRRTEAAGVSGYLLSAYAALAEVAVIIGAPRESWALEKTLQLAYVQSFVFAGPWALLIPRLLAGCAVLDGRLDQADHYFDHALRAARASGARIELARTFVDRAQMHAHHGGGSRSIARARADLSAAAPIARELGLRPLEQRARALARQLGASTRRRSRNP